MSALAATISALSAHAPLTALVGNRINPITAPQGSSYPLLIVHLISEDPAQHLLGAGYYNARVSIECHSQTATQAVSLGELVKAALEEAINRDFGTIRCSFRKEETDETDTSDDTAIKRRVQDWRCWWRNSA